MKVLFLTRSLDVGGAERQLVVLARGLAGRGHRVAVATFYGGGPLAADLEAAGVDVADLGKRGRLDTVGFFARLVARARAFGPDVVHSYLVAPNLAAATIRPWLPGVRVVWGVRASDMDLGAYGAFEEWTFQATRPLAATVDRIVANSNAGRRFHVARGYPAARTVVVPNGIDTGRFRPDAAARAIVREGLGLPPGIPLVGLVARVDPMKDHETFLRAAALLSRRRGDVRFVAAGGGPPGTLERLRDRARSLGVEDRVRFLGPRRDVERIQAALDVATSASAFGEGFPNAVGEAMACGVPCVVTDVGDSASIVGAPDLVVRRRDPAGLAAAWEAVLDGRVAIDRAALRLRIETRFSVERLIDRTEALLCDLVGERS